MKLTGALMQGKAVKETIEELKLRVNEVAKVQQGDVSAERPQAWLAALEANLQDLEARIAPIHPAYLWATRPGCTALMQVMAQCDSRNLWRTGLEASVTRELPMQGHDTYPTNARLDGRRGETTYSGRPAIHCLLEAARHHCIGGLRHVPAVAGLVHSQAPPIPHRSDTVS